MHCTQYNSNMNNYEIEYLILPNGKAPIIEWLNSLDSITRKRINQRILRIEDGNFGDYKNYQKTFTNYVLPLVKAIEFITLKKIIK